MQRPRDEGLPVAPHRLTEWRRAAVRLLRRAPDPAPGTGGAPGGETSRTAAGEWSTMRLSLTIKLAVAFAGTALITALGGLYVTTALQQTAAQYQAVIDNLEPARAASTAVAAAGNGLAGSLNGYILYKDDAANNYLNSAILDLNVALSELSHYMSSDEYRQTYASLKADASRWVDLARQIMVTADRPEEAMKLLTDQGRPLAAKIDTTIQVLDRQVNAAVLDATAAAQGQAASARRVAYAVLVVALILAIAVGLLFARAVAVPVRRVARAAQRLAAGDMTVEAIGVRSGDEVGAMAAAFNRMVLSLRQLVQGTTGSTEAVLSAAQQLSAASHQSSEGARGAARAVEEVAAGAAEQAQASDQVRSTMEQLQQTIQQLATGAQQTAMEMQQASQLLTEMVGALDDVAGSTAQVKESANRAATIAQSGAAVVGESVTGMQRIRAVVLESAQRIRDLESLSTQIGAITEVISGIADQTNLLALNAAIEAARAGEHGRGFAVVAEEVRRLAERSATSTREIAGLIGNIQARTGQAVKAMESGTGEVERGSRLADDAGRALQEILAAVEAAAREVQGIASAATQVRGGAEQVVRAFDTVAAVTEENTAATEEMAASVSEVLHAVERVAAVSQQNAASAEEVSATMVELNTSAGAVAASAHSLSEIAASLQGQVAQFSL